VQYEKEAKASEIVDDNQVDEDVDLIDKPNIDLMQYNRIAKASEIVDDNQVDEDVDSIDKPNLDLVQYNREAQASEIVDDNQVDEDIDPIDKPNMDLLQYNRIAKASEIIYNNQVDEDIDPIDKPNMDLLDYNREAKASETVEDDTNPAALETVEDSPNPEALETVENSPNSAALETDGPNPGASKIDDNSQSPAEDQFHEVIGFEHEDFVRIPNPGNSDTHNKRTLFTSNIQMAAGSSGVNFDIAVEKSCPQEESHTSELGNPEITSTINVQSIRNRRNGQIQRNEKSTRSRHFTFQRDGRISFNDILQTTLAFIDVVFWLIVAIGLVIYEICRGETVENLIGPVLSPNERPATPPPAPE